MIDTGVNNITTNVAFTATFLTFNYTPISLITHVNRKKVSQFIGFNDF